MVTIYKKGKYYYVKGDDCYIFYYLFNYRINNYKCYFQKKYLERILAILNVNQINYKVNDLEVNIYDKYVYYLEKGHEKYLFDVYLVIVK